MGQAVERNMQYWIALAESNDPRYYLISHSKQGLGMITDTLFEPANADAAKSGVGLVMPYFAVDYLKVNTVPIEADPNNPYGLGLHDRLDTAGRRRAPRVHTELARVVAFGEQEPGGLFVSLAASRQADLDARTKPRGRPGAGARCAAPSSAQSMSPASGAGCAVQQAGVGALGNASSHSTRETAAGDRARVAHMRTRVRPSSSQALFAKTT